MAFRLQYYTPEELSLIVCRSASILNVAIDEEGALEIARRSRGTPRLANRLLKRVRDWAQVRGDGAITEDVAAEALTFFEVDHLGLDAVDNRLLEVLCVQFGGRPVGRLRWRRRWRRIPTRWRMCTSPSSCNRAS